MITEHELNPEIASKDFLSFEFNDVKYEHQVKRATERTGNYCGIRSEIKKLDDDLYCVWMKHNFGFLGGSLGCAEGEKMCRGIEKAAELGIPCVIEVCSGGVRMQEGTLGLMQMAKVSTAIQAFKDKGLPYISVCTEPTYGGATASYAMQGDVRLAVKDARIGFAGPNVILNTIFKQNQESFDRECPKAFQTAAFLLKHGQLDIVVENEIELLKTVTNILNVFRRIPKPIDSHLFPSLEKIPDDYEELRMKEYDPFYINSRALARVQPQDILREIFTGFVELKGDGAVASEECMRGGLAFFGKQPVVVCSNFKDHTHPLLEKSNFGMAKSTGYRFAKRLMGLAEHFKLPFITLVDTPGAEPSFECEQTGQAEALASNLLRMSNLRTPIISLLVGEGGSGGALAVAMGDVIGMMSNAYYSVITPEGGASILGRYTSEHQKSVQFPIDCKTIASKQCIYANNLLSLGIIDKIVWEEPGEDFNGWPVTRRNITSFLADALARVQDLSPDDLVARRYSKFRNMGQFEELPPTKFTAPAVRLTSEGSSSPASITNRRVDIDLNRSSIPDISKLEDYQNTVTYIGDVMLNGKYSSFKFQAPSDIVSPEPFDPRGHKNTKSLPGSPKYILDHEGPEAVVKFLKQQKRTMITDTSMRDAHQSLLATRVRTVDLLSVCDETADVLGDAFSLEMWGGATFDVCYRFLHESPWDRLRLIRQKCPNILLQMLLRGSNGVGYTSYPDNVIERCVELAASNGIDVFRIFDCFNDLNQMIIAIKAVRRVKKIAEVAICFTGNFLDPNEKVYTLDYYVDLVKRYIEAGAHMLAIKDMAGLFKPQFAKPLMEAIRNISDIPIHFHTHNTSSAALTSVINMANAGCEVVDLAMASMADTTSQPSLNAFLSSMEGTDRHPGIDYRKLEHLDTQWAKIRSLYAPHESGLKNGTARVYEHQIPGGQYSNLIAQCKSLGIWHRWDEILDMYRDVNQLLGDLIKVTPSSKCVGDLALFLINGNMTIDDLKNNSASIEYPDSVKNLFFGKIGFPHHGLPKVIQHDVLKGKEPLKERPGKVMPPVDFEAKYAELFELYGSVTPEDVLSSCLYPDVFSSYKKFIKEYGQLMFLPSNVFFYGMEIGKKCDIVSLPLLDDPLNSQPDHYSVALKRVGPLDNEGKRKIIFLINGRSVPVEVMEKSESGGEEQAYSTMASPDNHTHVAAPIRGHITHIFTKVGAGFKKGDRLMTVAAYKMNIHVIAPFDGVLEKLCISPETLVEDGSLLAILKKV